MRSGAGGGKSPSGGSRYKPNEPKSEVGPREIIAFANAYAFARAFFYPVPSIERKGMLRSHRKANWCYRHNLKFLARWISQRSRRKTGIEIHPAAQIGKGLFIDHGMGVVIGETTQIGDNCTLYQGVTLGGTGKDHGKRHPTLGDNVLVGAGAKVLGPFTVGDNARVAAGAVVLDAVPPDATAVGVPARVVKIGNKRVEHPSQQLDQIHVADPVSMELCRLRGELERLQHRVESLEKPGTSPAAEG